MIEMMARPFDQVTMLKRTSERADDDNRAPVRPMPAPSAVEACPPHGTPSYLASVVDLAPLLPTVGTVATVFAYVGGPTAIASQLHQIPLVIGALSTALLGLI